MGDSGAVLDYGGRWLKAGWAFNFPTEEEPRKMTPNAVFVEQEGGGSELQRPVQRGKIASWEQFESLAYYALYDLMGLELGYEGNIMLSDAAHAADPSGQANGAASPMSDAAAGALTEEAAEALKELCARCAESESAYAAATGASGSPSATPAAPETFRLPDGQKFTVTTEGLSIGEALFRPGPLLGLVGPSPAEAACDSASSLDVVLRKVMMENMLLVGGGSVIPGVAARLVSEVRSMVSHSTNPNLIPTPEYMPSPAVPREAPWVGGAVVAKVAQIQNHFIFKADYDEAGPIAVHRRCS
ncbi:hypothetical protein HYH03_016793 [Edaphochlamys debaryana]|uniref:Actin n=1 Tax=Edaphochlamys debaryana TaxID=47281 RepID=A0A836BPW5_9CHLO|nr:hypothetical protein HYH03_016793 [Edaphochlamys debaryana]|eukprot:KAG2484377.1 hypothetical protein HYH03_016793 [Edaphochlamys debaryana]